MARVTDALGRPVSGVVPWAVSAVVEAHDDPERLGRVRVRFPTLPGGPTSGWLRTLTPAGGEAQGLYALPERGDEVLVLFLQGSQDAGVVLGALWNGARPPPPEADGDLPGPDATAVPGATRSRDAFTAGSGDDAGNDRRLWRSRSGHLVLLDDTPGAESVQLWDASRTLALVFDVAAQRVVLSNARGDLHVRAAGDLFLEAGRDVVCAAGRHLDAAARDAARVEAGALEARARRDARLAAGGHLELEATGDVRVTARANLRAEGVLVRVNGRSQAALTAGAMVEVRAGLVRIN